MIKHGNNRKCTITVETLINYWMDANAYNRKESTQERYRFLVQKHIIPKLGDVDLSELTSDMLNEFIEDKLRRGRLDGTGGLSPGTVNDIYLIIKSSLKMANYRYHYYNYEMENVKTPVVKKKKIEVFSESETEKMIRSILENPTLTGIAVLLGLETGLRIGEVCALRWSDIDFEDHLLYVRRTALRINYGGWSELVIQSPKSESSERVIPLTRKTCDFLYKIHGEITKDVYILTSDPNIPMDPRTLQYRFRTFLKKNKVKHRSFHALRHSFATRSVERGVDIKSLSEILGHSNVRTTLQLYVHPSMKDKRRYMELSSIVNL